MDTAASCRAGCHRMYLNPQPAGACVHGLMSWDWAWEVVWIQQPVLSSNTPSQIQSALNLRVWQKAVKVLEMEMAFFYWVKVVILYLCASCRLLLVPSTVEIIYQVSCFYCVLESSSTFVNMFLKVCWLSLVLFIFMRFFPSFFAQTSFQLDFSSITLILLAFITCIIFVKYLTWHSDVEDTHKQNLVGHHNKVITVQWSNVSEDKWGGKGHWEAGSKWALHQLCKEPADYIV